MPKEDYSDTGLDALLYLLITTVYAVQIHVVRWAVSTLPPTYQVRYIGYRYFRQPRHLRYGKYPSKYMYVGRDTVATPGAY